MAIPKENFLDSFKMFTTVNAHIFKVIHSMDNLWNRTKNVYNNKTKSNFRKITYTKRHYFWKAKLMPRNLGKHKSSSC